MGSFCTRSPQPTGTLTTATIPAALAQFLRLRLPQLSLKFEIIGPLWYEWVPRGHLVPQGPVDARQMVCFPSRREGV